MGRAFLTEIEEQGQGDGEEEQGGRQLRFCSPRGRALGLIRRGQDPKWLEVVDGQRIPGSKRLALAWPQESKLLAATLAHIGPGNGLLEKRCSPH